MVFLFFGFFQQGTTPGRFLVEGGILFHVYELVVEEKIGYPKGLASTAFVTGVLLRLRRPRALGRRASLRISREEEGAGRSTQRQGKGASASATLLCICSVVLIYLDLR